MKFQRTILVLLALAAGLSLGAESIELSIIDRDLDYPLEGAMIQLVGRDEPLYADEAGRAILSLPKTTRRHVVIISYPGYESVRLPLSGSDEPLVVPMVLSGIIEGEELVVERTAPGEREEESGISIVMDREQMETTANIGIVEDVMSSVKTLPGVSYTSSWNAQPSIRGGYPEEMAAALDGFYITYPFHWGGAYSIFNPNMVETAKLSHGIYSARYGRALSGILEISTKNQDEPEIRVDGALSTTSTDLFLQTPLGPSSGLFIGGKITYLDTTKLVFPEETQDITSMPFIRDLYAKWQWSPGNAIDIYLNGFLGTDGVGMETTFTDEEDEFSSDILFDYHYINTFLSGGIRWAPSDTLFIDFLAGVNWNLMNMEFELSDRGTREYSQDFLDSWGLAYGLNPGDTYAIDGLDTRGKQDTDLRQGQLKLTAEKLLDDENILVFGTEQVLKQTSQNSEFSGWFSQFNEGTGTFEFVESTFSIDVDANYSLNPAVFFIWEFGNDRSRLSGELGLRAEHYLIWNDDFFMNALPAVNPRASVSWKAAEDVLGIDRINLTCGSGLFSYFSLNTELVDEEYGIDDWSVAPDQALFNIVGTELLWDRGWKISAETYYKYYLNRLILTTDQGTGSTSEFNYNTKGKGHIWGFDTMIQKKNGRRWDGYLSYSLIYARYYNPSNTGTDTEENAMGSGTPLDLWYYPYYHRYHSLNLVCNWHFLPGWTLSAMGALATGAPRGDVGDVSVYPADLDGTTIEQYARTSFYSDTLRDGFSIPVDLRLSYGRYGRNSKIYTEWYVAVEDIFVNLYKPETNSSFNANTGEENQDTSADFNIGIPVPSFGLKISY